MTRPRRPRNRRSGEVLSRPPWTVSGDADPTTAEVRSQLDELAELAERGLLSQDELERQRGRLLGLLDE